MRCKKLKSILSIAAASVISSAAMLNASASISIDPESPLTSYTIDSVFSFGDSSGTTITLNPEYKATAINVKDFDETAFDNTVVTDVCCTLNELGLSVAMDYYVGADDCIMLNNVYFIVTDLIDSVSHNVIYVPKAATTEDYTVSELIDFDNFIKEVFPNDEVMISTTAESVFNQMHLDIPIKGIMLTEDFVVNAQTFDYLFLDKSIDMIESPINGNYMSSQILSGGIYSRDTNRYISTVNRDAVVERYKGLIYHNYPHSYENENVSDGVLTVPYANNLDKVANWAFANTDWSGIDEIVFSNGIKEIGNIFANNNNIPTTLTFEDPEVTVGIENMVEYVNTVKGYKGSGAETFANEYDIPFIALDEDEPVITTTTEPVVTTTTSTSVSTTESESETTTTTSSTSNEETTSTTTSESTAENQIGTGTTTSTDIATPNLRGDANQDGTVNVRDAAFIARALACKEANTLPEMADFNVDGKVDVRDAAAIARHLATKPKPEASSTSTVIEKPVETTTTTISQTEDPTNTETTTTAETSNTEVTTSATVASFDAEIRSKKF